MGEGDLAGSVNSQPFLQLFRYRPTFCTPDIEHQFSMNFAL